MDISLLLLRTGMALTVGCWIMLTFTVMRVILAEEAEKKINEMVRNFGAIDQIAGAFLVATGLIFGASLARHEQVWMIASGLGGILMTAAWISRLASKWRHRNCTEDECAVEAKDEADEEDEPTE
jgi:hypothetical protein